MTDYYSTSICPSQLMVFLPADHLGQSATEKAFEKSYICEESSNICCRYLCPLLSQGRCSYTMTDAHRVGSLPYGPEDYQEGGYDWQAIIIRLKHRR